MSRQKGSKQKINKVISKQSCRKGLVNTPEGMTEAQHAELDGLVKVYDAGKLKLVYKKPE